jgi:hypothetical protein
MASSDISSLLQELDVQQLGSLDSALNEFIQTQQQSLPRTSQEQASPPSAAELLLDKPQLSSHVSPPPVSHAGSSIAPATSTQSPGVAASTGAGVGQDDDGTGFVPPPPPRKLVPPAAEDPPLGVLLSNDDDRGGYRIDDKITQILFSEVDVETDSGVAVTGAEAEAEPILSDALQELLAGVVEAMEAILAYFQAGPRSDREMMEMADDQFSRRIAILVRGRLANALARVFQHRMKPQMRIFDQKFTIWNVLELHLRSSSHGTLPGISLDRSIRALNSNHMLCDPHQRFRALICLGLNEHRLDQWLQIFCQHNARAIAAIYHKDAALRNPILIDLVARQLHKVANFPFSLSLEYEFLASISAKTTPPSPTIAAPE